MAQSPAPLWLFGPPVLTAFLWLLTPHSPSAESALFALLLASLPTAAYVDWRQRAVSTMVPLLSMVSAMYWLYFCFAFFLGSRQLMGISGNIRLDEDSLAAALAMASAGVLAMTAGYAVGPHIVLRRVAVLPDTPRTSRYLCGVLALGMTLSAVESSVLWFGPGGRQLMVLLQSFVPLVAFAYLFGKSLDGEATSMQRRFLFAYSSVRVLAAVASGWLGPLFSLVAVALGTFLARRRKLPIAALLIATALLLFFQAGKYGFRSNYWYRADESGKVERAAFWVGESFEQWRLALTDPEPGRLQKILGGIIGRVSLLEQTANVLQLTPALIPFQEGASYGYMLVGFVPRLLWPDKPSVNDANRAYQVAYGLTAERNLDQVSISVGTLTEGYVNFGWTGVITVMSGLGLFLRMFERIFLSRGSGPFFLAVGLSLMPPLLVIEAQLAQYIGGFAQHVLVAIAVFWPVLEMRPATGTGEGEGQP
jgi:hypothetical protein